MVVVWWWCCLQPPFYCSAQNNNQNHKQIIFISKNVQNSKGTTVATVAGFHIVEVLHWNFFAIDHQATQLLVIISIC